MERNGNGGGSQGAEISRRRKKPVILGERELRSRQRNLLEEKGEG